MKWVSGKVCFSCIAPDPQGVVRGAGTLRTQWGHASIRSQPIGEYLKVSASGGLAFLNKIRLKLKTCFVGNSRALSSLECVDGR